jgi:hypothetical protein
VSAPATNLGYAPALPDLNVFSVDKLTEVFHCFLVVGALNDFGWPR